MRPIEAVRVGVLTLSEIRNIIFSVNRFFMDILSISDRGQVTLPKDVRDQIAVKHFTCTVKDGSVILEPLQTRDEFLEELDAAEKEWVEKGGLSVSQMRKKYKIAK